MAETKKTEEKSSILENSQEAAMDLLCHLHEICEKYHINYFLTEDTLLGAERNAGFLEDAHTISVGMLLNDYRKFCQACEKGNDSYYVTGIEKRDDIEEINSYFAKRSRVVLPEGRKQDEFYYDFYIKIIPVIPVGSSNRKLIQRKRELLRANRIINARILVNKKIGLQYLKWIITNAFYLNKDREKAKEFVRNIYINTEEGSFCLYPTNKKENLLFLCESYTSLEKVTFQGRKFWTIRNRKEWLKAFYGKDCIQGQYKSKPNAMLMKGPEEIRRVQLVQLEILKEIDRICRKHKINYFLCSGTLLGAVRHKGFIPWDYDADVAMLKKDYDCFLKICKEEIDWEKYFVRNIESEPTIHITYTQIRRQGTRFIRLGREKNKLAHHGILVDVFPVYRSPGKWIRHWCQTKICMFYKTMFWTHNGAASEKNRLKRMWYQFLAKFPPLFSYQKYMKYACCYENKNTKKVSWLVAKNNPYFSDFTEADVYSEYCDIEFEGCLFQTIKAKERYLTAVYSEQYMLFLPKEERINGFVPSAFDAGDLYQY